ncbi:endotoxic shock protective protein U9-ORF-like [Odocoileus virginianus]|uniref:Endotoxic shock protective protein U9-ORF-like n=1 Tax=Odocoileus virginianus TaxID=9874 RepID=A0ABM4HFP1_ODOVR
MKVVFLIAFLLVMAHCAPVREFNPGIRHDYFLNWQRIHHRMSSYQLFLYHKYLQRLYELCNAFRKPPVNRGTTIDSMLSFSPVTETAPPLTSTPSGLFTPSGPSTPDRRGDM